MYPIGHYYHLPLERCPHCSRARPTISVAVVQGIRSIYYWPDTEVPHWIVYECTFCKHFILASFAQSGELKGHWPSSKTNVSETIPDKVQRFLKQAIDITSQPDACIMMCNGAIDAMFKIKGLEEGSLYERIPKAAETHIITPDMAEWANHVRLESNNIRHADTKSSVPTIAEAKQCLEFALTLAEILFVLPARVSHGKKTAEEAKASDAETSNKPD